MELIQYIILNNEIKMTCGKKCSQTAHASISVLEKIDKEKIEEWKKQGMKKVVLKIDSTDEMVNLFQKLKTIGLPVALITDAGKTQIPTGSKTAFACGPITKEKGNKHFYDLKLL